MVDRNDLDDNVARYLPFNGGRFRLSMGLMPLPVAEWLAVDRSLAEILDAKRGLLAARHAEVFAAKAEADAPAAELLQLLGRHLPQHHAAIFHRDGDRLENRATGERWDLARPALHPLDLAGRLIAEDLCLLQSAGGPFRLTAASLSAPARWRLREKLGRPLIGVHEPVPGYGEELARPVDRFFAALRPGRLVWRLNWGIVDDPARFQPVAPPPAVGITEQNAGDRLWLRVERQTLRRLRESGAVVFTIGTHITPLGAAIRSSTSAAELASLVRGMPEAMRRYKQIVPFAPTLLAWLDRRATTPSG